MLGKGRPPASSESASLSTLQSLRPSLPLLSPPERPFDAIQAEGQIIHQPADFRPPEAESFPPPWGSWGKARLGCHSISAVTYPSLGPLRASTPPPTRGIPLMDLHHPAQALPTGMGPPSTDRCCAAEVNKEN